MKEISQLELNARKAKRALAEINRPGRSDYRPLTQYEIGKLNAIKESLSRINKRNNVASIRQFEEMPETASLFELANKRKIWIRTGWLNGYDDGRGQVLLFAEDVTPGIVHLYIKGSGRNDNVYFWALATDFMDDTESCDDKMIMTMYREPLIDE